jgi:tetratricopeptide (TPR) repeat protein
VLTSWFARRAARRSFAEGVAALDRGDTDLALSWFDSAVRECARCAHGFLGRGLAHLRKGAFDAAIADLSEAIRLSGDARAFFLRALCYEGKGDRAREGADHREALRRDPRVARSLHAV